MHNVTFYRFISFASCWGDNKVPFLAAAAFICQHLMMKGQTFDNAGMLQVRLEFAIRVLFCFVFFFQIQIHEFHKAFFTAF